MDTDTCVVNLGGRVVQPQTIEVPLSYPLSRIINEIGGGVEQGHSFKAVQIGGLSGGIFSLNHLSLSLDHETFQKWCSTSTEISIWVMDERDCLVSFIHKQVRSILKQPEGVRYSCKKLLCMIDTLLSQTIDGVATLDTLEKLKQLGEDLEDLSTFQPECDISKPLLTSLQFFQREYQLHLENKYCPAKVCPKLLAAPCQEACPTHIDIPSYLGLVMQGRYKEALEVIRQDNPFPWVCGLICPHPCEKVCTRGCLDEPINIRYLKAFVAEWTTKHGDYAPLKPQPFNGHKVAVVGSGPAGLSCAHYLAMKGYHVTIFESLPHSGGLLVTGIPEYRLPREVVHREIELIKSIGVEILTGITIGKDITLDELRHKGNEAIFLAIGAHLGYKLNIEGEDDFPQVYDAITFLRQVNYGVKQKPANRVVIIGGGNAVMDAARVCMRLGCEEVHIAYRRTRQEMPASPGEIQHAIEEGIQIHFLAIPVKIGGENGRVTYLECLQAELGSPDASGRRKPVPIQGSNFCIPADAVIKAIGQQPDLSPFSEPPVQTTKWGTIITEPFSTRTSVPYIFAGGDAVTGPATVVQAIAAGKQAASDIDHYLSGSNEPSPYIYPYKRQKIPFLSIQADEKISTHRVPLPLVPPEERKHNFETVELNYTEIEARQEAKRCLRCDICIRCGICEKVCRDDVKAHALIFSPIDAKTRLLSDYYTPQERCIACGSCALACPTQAIDYIEGRDYREIRLCGTVLNHLAVPKCEICGEPFIPGRYLKYVINRSDAVIEKPIERHLCAQCARRQKAEKFVHIW